MEEIDLRDLFGVLWKRRWQIVILTILLPVLVFAGSMMLPKSYSSQAQLELGDFKNAMYNDPLVVRETFLSNEMLEPIQKQLNLNFETLEAFRQALQINNVERTKLLKVQVRYGDPETAQKIVDALLTSFLAKSEQAYADMTKPLKDLRAELEKQTEQNDASLQRNKAALTSVETNTALSGTEKDITRARLLDYVAQEEERQQELAMEVKDVDVKLTEMRSSSLVSQAMLSGDPVFPQPVLYAAIALVLGFILGIVVAVIREFFAADSILTTKR